MLTASMMRSSHDDLRIVTPMLLRSPWCPMMTDLDCLAFGCEFLALLLIFVYVGSISILFLFSAMFLDLWAFRFNSFGFHFSRHLAPAFWWDPSHARMITNITFDEIQPWWVLLFVTMFKPSVSQPCYPFVETSYYQCQWLDLYTARSNVSNLNQLGLFLYTDYSLPFLVAAFQLLVAMLAAIVVSLVWLQPWQPT